MGRALQEVLFGRRSQERQKIGSFTPEATEESIKRERAAARELRKSAWWKRRLSAGKCYYCNKAVPPKDLTMDHLVPLIRGGKSQKNNLVAACKECNNRKKNLLPLEWEEYLNSIRTEED